MKMISFVCINFLRPIFGDLKTQQSHLFCKIDPQKFYFSQIIVIRCVFLGL